jgi:hypothetical protein
MMAWMRILSRCAAIVLVLAGLGVAAAGMLAVGTVVAHWIEAPAPAARALG